MENTAENRNRLRQIVTCMERLPDGVDVMVGTGEPGVLYVQAHTQAGVAQVRACFPGVFWRKCRDETLGWWDYIAQLPDGVTINIYACHEAPPTCHAIETEEEVEEHVPVAFETRKVMKKIVRWDCGPGETPA